MLFGLSNTIHKVQVTILKRGQTDWMKSKSILLWLIMHFSSFRITAVGILFMIEAKASYSRRPYKLPVLAPDIWCTM